MKYNNTKYTPHNDGILNQIKILPIYIKNGELEKAKEILSLLEKTVIKNYKTSPLKKQIDLYKNQIKQKEVVYTGTNETT